MNGAWNKNQILQALRDQLEVDLQNLKKAALATYEDATHEENKPENKYDTRALEASYLAGAQAERVQDVSELLALCKVMKVKNFSDEDPIAIGALVEVRLESKNSYLFFLPKGGGVSFYFEKTKIQVITPISPLGKAFLGLSASENVIIESGSQKRNYEIISVI